MDWIIISTTLKIKPDFGRKSECMPFTKQDIRFYETILECISQAILVFEVDSGGAFSVLVYANDCAKKNLGNLETMESAHLHEIINECDNKRVNEFEIDGILYRAVYFDNGVESLEFKNLLDSNRMVRMGEMVGAITHQWRQPLSSIKLLAHDLLEAHRFNELTLGYLASIKHDISCHVDYLSFTIDDFCDFYKVDREKKQIELSRTIKEVMRLVSSQLQLAGIKTELLLPRDEVFISGYPNELKQVFLNIIANSKEALFGRAEIDGSFDMEIKVSLFDEPECVRIVFSDNGLGIQDDQRDKIFEHGHTSSGHRGGMGLGLFLAEKILKKSFNAEILLKNSAKPTEFELRFPMRANQGSRG